MNEYLINAVWRGGSFRTGLGVRQGIIKGILGGEKAGHPSRGRFWKAVQSGSFCLYSVLGIYWQLWEHWIRKEG